VIDPKGLTLYAFFSTLRGARATDPIEWREILHKTLDSLLDGVESEPSGFLFMIFESIDDSIEAIAESGGIMNFDHFITYL